MRRERIFRQNQLTTCSTRAKRITIEHTASGINNRLVDGAEQRQRRDEPGIDVASCRRPSRRRHGDGLKTKI